MLQLNGSKTKWSSIVNIAECQRYQPGGGGGLISCLNIQELLHTRHSKHNQLNRIIWLFFGFMKALLLFNTWISHEIELIKNKREIVSPLPE